MSRSRTHPHFKGEQGKTSGGNGGGGRTTDDEWWTMVVHRDAKVELGLETQFGAIGVGDRGQIDGTRGDECAGWPGNGAGPRN